MRRMPLPVAVDLSALLARADLEAIGLVLVHPHCRTTVTLWCAPSVDPTPLFQQAAAAGQVPAALVCVCAHEVVVLLHDAWRVGWVTDYVDHVAADIQRAGGLPAFFETLDQASVVAADN